MIWIGTVLAFIGALLCLLAAIGLLRLSDPLSRLQAVTKASTLGFAFTLAGTVVVQPQIDIFVKAGVALVFLSLASTVSGHLTARAAYLAGLTGTLSVDEIAD